AVDDARSRRLEDVRRLLVQGQGGFELLGERLVVGEQPACARGTRERPRLPFRARALLVWRGHGRGVVGTGEREVGLDELRRRRQVGVLDLALVQELVPLLVVPYSLLRPSEPELE